MQNIEIESKISKTENLELIRAIFELFGSSQNFHREVRALSEVKFSSFLDLKN